MKKIDLTDNREIIISPMAIHAPRVAHVPHGSSIRDMVNSFYPDLSVVVEIDGIPIVREKWGMVPAVDSHVLISIPLHGGGKDPLRTLLTIIVIVAAAYFGGMAGGALAGKMGVTSAAGISMVTGFTKAAMMTAGMMLVDAIAPIKFPEAPSRLSYSDSPTYSLTEGRNVENPWGAVPVNLGRNRVYPPLGAKSYTEIVGGDEYLRMLLIWGYGPQRIEDLKIGDTPFSSYDNVEIETREGWSTDAPITLFPSQVYQDKGSFNVELTATGGMVTRTAEPNVDELSVDIAFPFGLVRFADDGSRVTHEVQVQIQYREVGAEGWSEVLFTYNRAVIGTSFRFYGQNNYPEIGTYSIYVRVLTGAVSYLVGTDEIGGDYRIGEFDVAMVVNWDDILEKQIVAARKIFHGNVTGCAISHTYFSVAVGNGTVGPISTPSSVFIDKTISAIRYGTSWPVDRTKEYEIGITRLTADTEDTQIIDGVYWANIRGILDEHPVDFPFPVAMTAIRIKATDQLQGVIDTINGIVSSYAPVWNSVSEVWGAYAVTNNPAALMRHVLTCKANARVRTLTQIDNNTLADWYEFCTTNGYAYNMYRDFTSSVWSTCADICSTGRASPTITDGLWSVTADTGTQALIQHITPRNSWGFSAEKVLYNRPHAFRIKFVNEDNGYAWDERIVYDDGYTSTNATLFESLDLPGITDPNLIWKFGRFHIAQARLRPEMYSLYQDFEHLICRRGDKVRVSHDVPLWGSGWGRVKELTTAGGNITHITLDESVIMELGKSYACRFRLAIGATLVVSIVLDVGETAVLELQTPVSITSGPAVGDLAMFGEADRETVELLVHSIQRAGDFTAQIFFVDVATAIYTADTGAIPAFNPQTTAPVDATKLPPDPPTIDNTASGTDISTTSGGGSVSTLIVYLSAPSNAIRIRGYRLRYRITGESEWQYTAEMSNLTITISSVIEGVEYEIQAQSISIFGAHGVWTIAGTGTSTLPQIVPSSATNISAELVIGGASYSYCAVHVMFTPPTDAVYSFSEIYASKDNLTYSYVGRDGTGSFTFGGLGSIYELEDTCYIKLRSVSIYAVAGIFSASYDTWVLIDDVIRLGGFYVGLASFGDNKSWDHAKILIDKPNTLIRLGDTAKPYLVMDGNYGGVPAVRSSNYVSGYMGAGFILKSDLLEVGNIACRGIFRTNIFQKDSISVVGGNVLILAGDVLVEDMTALDTDD